MPHQTGPRRSQTILAGLFLLLLIVGSYVIAFVGWGSPAQSGACTFNKIAKTGCQMGTDFIQVLTGSGNNFGTKTITFTQAFATTPKVFVTLTIPTTTVYDLFMTFLAPGTPQMWTNMPNAQTELFGNTFNRQVEQWGSDDQFFCGLFVNVVNAGAAGAILKVQSSQDLSTWTDLLSSADGDVPIDSANTLSFSTNAYGLNPSGAQPFLRIVGQGGDGATDPSFGLIFVECHSFVASTSVSADLSTTTNFRARVDSFLPSTANFQIDFNWIATT